MRRTDSRCLASWMAREQEVVVLPTPPLPPTKIHLRLSSRRRERQLAESALGQGRG